PAPSIRTSSIRTRTLMRRRCRQDFADVLSGIDSSICQLSFLIHPIHNQIGRVAGKHYCFPAPSELHVTVARHAAQAFTNAPRGTRPPWQRASRYAPGADGPSTRPSGRAHDQELHQQAFLLLSYLLVSLSRLAEVLS